MIKQIHHISLLVSDLKKSIEFYRDVLSLSVSDKRPELDFDGIWFEVGSQQIHLICSMEADKQISRHRCGKDRHLALQVDDIGAMKESLKHAGIEFEQSRSGRPAIFCRDPDGNALEFIGTL